MQGKESTTEQMILETAERLFLDKGFAMTSTTEIAKEVGCNQAMVHYYFRTKERLFEAVFEKKIKKFIAPFLQTTNENKPFKERLILLIETHFEIIKDNPKIPFLFFNELLTNPTRLESFKNKFSELPRSVFFKLSKDLEEEVDKGTIRPMNFIDLLMTIVSLNVSIFLMAPIFKNVTNMSDEDFNKILANRKHENGRMMMNSLQP